jgi:glycerophosphoryl diester phosphodiesterase
LFDTGSPLERLRTLVCDFEILDADLVDAARAHGWRIWAYGLKTRDEHVACGALGLDGIITDHPELGLEVR